MSIEEVEAGSLGVRSRQVRLWVIAAATLGTAAAVAAGGLIGFVGIIVPHAISLVGGTSYRLVLPLCLFFGAAFLVLADVLARPLCRRPSCLSASSPHSSGRRFSPCCFGRVQGEVEWSHGHGDGGGCRWRLEGGHRAGRRGSRRRGQGEGRRHRSQRRGEVDPAQGDRRAAGLQGRFGWATPPMARSRRTWRTWSPTCPRTRSSSRR